MPDHTKKRRGTPRRFVTCQTRSASIVPVPVLPTPASVAFHPAVGNPVCVAVRMYTVTLHPDVSSTAPIPVSRRPLPPRPNDRNGLVTWRRRRDPDIYVGRGRAGLLIATAALAGPSHGRFSRTIGPQRRSTHEWTCRLDEVATPVASEPPARQRARRALRLFMYRSSRIARPQLRTALRGGRSDASRCHCKTRGASK